MYKHWLLEIAIFLTILTILAIPMGEYMAKVFTNQRNILSPIMLPVENYLYKLFKIDAREDMNWKVFALNFFWFNLIGIIFLFLLQLAQGFLPLNPEHFGAIRWDTALNAAISYVTNTNWQPYPIESTLSYLTQMLGFSLQNFVAVASGMAVSIAFINAFVRKNTKELGNFWVYLTKSLLYILLPLALILSILFLAQGCPDNLNPYTHAVTLEGNEQIIAQGPVASQIGAKVLGGGGGYFTANAAHPYENPTPFTDYLMIFSFLILAAAFPFTFGAMTNNRASGWAIFIAMMLLFILFLGVAIWSESQGNPLLAKLGLINGANMEGKEVRLGVLSSVMFCTSSAAASAGAVNAALDSLMPITGLICLLHMALGGVGFGCAGLGLVMMLFYAMLAMFLIGLMIGRTPEIYGKKLGSYEMIMINLMLFLPGALQLIFGAIAAATNIGTATLTSHSPHGLTQIAYTYISTIVNNGSAFNEFKTDNLFYNLTTGFGMFIGRAIVIVCTLATAGSIAAKKISPQVSCFATTNLLFIFVLLAVILVFGVSIFLPIVVLGPIMEHLAILKGQVF